jgi:hypothetical protein
MDDDAYTADDAMVMKEGGIRKRLSSRRSSTITGSLSSKV